MIKIAVTTTATMRPDILEKTFNSFISNLFNLVDKSLTQFILFMNIDPIPDVDSFPYIQITNKLNSVFDFAVYQSAITADFPTAFKWCWNTALQYSPDFIFNLEDDWELLKPVNITNMLHIFQKYLTLQVLRLNAFKSTDTATKNWNLIIPWNGVFFELPKNLRHFGFAGHPSLIRADFARAVNAKLQEDTKNRNHEKYIHEIIANSDLKDCRYGVYGPQNSGPVIKDIGREWMIKNKLRKRGSKAHFNTWEAAG